MHRHLTQLCAALLAFAISVPVQAQTWPERAVKIVVPFAPGGPADVYARAIGAALKDALHQPFVIENMPGGGAVVGTQAVAKAAPDGYTLLMMSNTHTVNETLMPNAPYKLMKDFVGIAPVNYSDLLLVAHPKLGVNTLPELLALVKGKPGGFDYASSGPGTPYHMAGELFKAMGGLDIVHVPYKGSAGARTDILGGHVGMMFDAITVMLPNVQSGALKGLATTGAQRSPITPNIPTVSEAGVPGYEATIWLGLMAPAATPKPIVEKLNAEVRKVIARPELREQWQKQGAQPMDMTTAQFAAYLNRDIAKWADVVKRANIKLE